MLRLPVTEGGLAEGVTRHFVADERRITLPLICPTGYGLGFLLPPIVSPRERSPGRAWLLFFQHGVALFDQPFKFLLLLKNALRCSFFILRARRCSSLFNQLPDIVLKYPDAVVEFW